MLGARCGVCGQGFLLSSGVLPEAGGQFIPAKGLSGLTRGEQRCASGAAFSPAACEPVCGKGGSPRPGWRGLIGEAGRDGANAFGGKSGAGAGAASTGGVNPPGGEGDGVSTSVQPCFPFGWSVRTVRPSGPVQL